MKLMRGNSDFKESNTIFIHPQSLRRLNAFFCILSFLNCIVCWFFLDGVVVIYTWYDYIPFLGSNLESLVEKGYYRVAFSYFVMYVSQVFLGVAFIFVFFSSMKVKGDICDSLVTYKERVFSYWGRGRTWLAYGLTLIFFPFLVIATFVTYGEIEFYQGGYYSLNANRLYRSFFSFYMFSFFLYLPFYVLTAHLYVLYRLILTKK